jgi:hypothetical protein
LRAPNTPVEQRSRDLHRPVPRACSPSAVGRVFSRERVFSTKLVNGRMQGWRTAFHGTTSHVPTIQRRQDKELRDRSLWKGRIVSHPDDSGMTRRKREGCVHIQLLSENERPSYHRSVRKTRRGRVSGMYTGFGPLRHRPLYGFRTLREN